MTNSFFGGVHREATWRHGGATAGWHAVETTPETTTKRCTNQIHLLGTAWKDGYSSILPKHMFQGWSSMLKVDIDQTKAKCHLCNQVVSEMTISIYQAFVYHLPVTSAKTCEHHLNAWNDVSCEPWKLASHEMWSTSLTLSWLLTESDWKILEVKNWNCHIWTHSAIFLQRNNVASIEAEVGFSEQLCCVLSTPARNFRNWCATVRHQQMYFQTWQNRWLKKHDLYDLAHPSSNDEVASCRLYKIEGCEGRDVQVMSPQHLHPPSWPSKVWAGYVPISRPSPSPSNARSTGWWYLNKTPNWSKLFHFTPKYITTQNNSRFQGVGHMFYFCQSYRWWPQPRTATCPAHRVTIPERLRPVTGRSRRRGQSRCCNLTGTRGCGAVSCDVVWIVGLAGEMNYF